MGLTAASVARVKRGHQMVTAATARAQAETLEAAGEYAKSYVNRFPTFKPRTGNLQAKAGAKVVRTKGGSLLKLYNTAKYAKSIENGAKPHVILPRRGKFLVFRGRSGKLVFARKVNHPGNRPYRFLYRATQSAFRVAHKSMAKRMADIARRF